MHMFALSLTTAVYFVGVGGQAHDTSINNHCVFNTYGVEVLLELFCNIAVVQT